jgi:hypothetical protein
MLRMRFYLTRSQLNSGVRPQQSPMLSNEQLNRISPLARHFREQFSREFAQVAYVEEFTDRYELAIPPAHPEVGELRVRDDGDELTISVGPHHWHVPLYLYEDAPEPERARLAAGAAVDGVRDVLEERTILRVTHRGGHLASTQSYSVDHPGVRPPTAEDKEYTWTGPRARFH